jgi:hypothetical protein
VVLMTRLIIVPRLRPVKDLALIRMPQLSVAGSGQLRRRQTIDIGDMTAELLREKSLDERRSSLAQSGPTFSKILTHLSDFY